MAAQLLVLYNTPTDPTHFEQYYFGTHVPLVKRLPGLRSYTVNKGALGGPGGTAPYYFVAMLDFDSLAALEQSLASPEGVIAAGDLPNFATGGASLVMYETQILQAN